MPTRNGHRTRRARFACLQCKLRKVRCNVALSGGPPCINCSIDGVSCEVVPRKQRLNQDLLSDSIESPAANEPESITVHASGIEAVPVSSPHIRVDTLAAECGPRSSLVGVNVASSTANPPHYPSTPSPCSTEGRNGEDPDRQHPHNSPRAATWSHYCQGSPESNPRDASAFANTLEGNSKVKDRVPFYPGDRRGPAFVLDICRPGRSSESNHFYVPKPLIEALQPEDVQYLKVKGVFALPSRHIQEELIRCYFHHIHPMAPIIDPDDFIPKYGKGRVSLLLLWSIFVAAGSFIDESVLLSEDSFPNKLILKRASYHRAKTLYNMEYETDKITLIQSTYLLSHWYANTEDRTGPWHWNGIAISLSHTIGLHMLKASTSKEIHPLWRCIWWSIYCREVWLSMGLGRPVRISFDDFDTPMPDADDGMIIFSPQRTEKVARYLPFGFSELSWAWMCVLKVSQMLGSILATNYRAQTATPSMSQLTSTETTIHGYLPPIIVCHQDRVTAPHFYQCRLYVLSTIVALYRPFMSDGNPKHLSKHTQSTMGSFSSQRARAAATEAVGAVNSMLAAGLTGLCQTISVIAMVPIMQVHLIESTASNPTQREAGSHNLALCMLVMSELRKSYVSADAAYLLFKKATLQTSGSNLTNGYKQKDAHYTRGQSPEGHANLQPQNNDYESQALSNTGILSSLWTSNFSTFGIESIEPSSFDDWLNIENMTWDQE